MKKSFWIGAIAAAAIASQSALGACVTGDDAKGAVAGNVTVAAFSAVTFGAGSTIASLTMDENAVFKPNGTGYLAISTALSGTIALDTGDIDLASAKRIPLLKVPSSLKEAASGAFNRTSVPKDWYLMAMEADGIVFYDLRKKEFLVIIR